MLAASHDFRPSRFAREYPAMSLFRLLLSLVLVALLAVPAAAEPILKAARANNTLEKQLTGTTPVPAVRP